MPIRTEPLEEPTLILTPMVDIVMLIMIFFMVSTEFRRMENQYEINLPTVSDAMPLTPMPDEIVVNVSKSGTLSMGTDPVTFDQLEIALREAKQRYSGQSVIIRGDGDGRYQHVVSVMNICQRVGITNPQLAVRVQDGAGE